MPRGEGSPVLSADRRERRSFAKIPEVLDVPNLIAIQRDSFTWFLDEGLRETFQDISPIEDFTGTLAVEFGAHEFGEPKYSVEECKEKDMSFQAPLFVDVRFINKETGEMKEQSVFMGDFPLMTDRGTFVINGTERVVVSQLVRSPGVYYAEELDKTTDKIIYTAKVIPARGAWLELETDRRDIVSRPCRPQAQAARDGAAQGARHRRDPRRDPRDVRRLRVHRAHAGARLHRDPRRSSARDLQAPASGRAAHGRVRACAARRAVLQPAALRLGQGRPLQGQQEARSCKLPDEQSTLTPEDIKAAIYYLVKLWEGEDGYQIDDIDHFGNRRIRSVGELIQNQFRIGLARMERVVRERMTTQDVDEITPQSLINIRPIVASIKEFFGSSQLSQFMDQTNPVAGLTHKRRLSALGPGGLSRERAGFEVRDVHPSHYGRMCPIETPEGPNIGLIGSLATFARINPYGFIETPYRKVVKGKVTDEIEYLTADEEEQHVIAQANEPFSITTRQVRECEGALPREGAGRWTASSASRKSANPEEVDYMDVSPRQMVSVATALIPFLEHDDANRALMGSNMQRQAVPLMRPSSPLVGTGLEYRAAKDTGEIILAKRDGVVERVDSQIIVVRAKKDGTLDEYRLPKFQRSNQGTCINHRPLVREGEKVKSGQVLADGPSTESGELALGQNLLCAFMPWEGYNYEDAIILSERIVKDDLLTSIHIEEYEVEARDTKLGPEEITREIPNVGEDVLLNLDEDGIIRVGAEVFPGDVLVGKVTPKGETELTAEERLLRAIFGEKAREVRDTSLKVPHGETGRVIAVRQFSRDAGDDLSPGVNELVRVYVAQKRKIQEGDKLAGRHGNKGVISKILPVEDMPFLADGRHVDIILNPLGVPSRMNIGQLLETHLGWAASVGWNDDKKSKTAVDGPIHVATPVFDGAREEEISAGHRGLQPQPQDSRTRALRQEGAEPVRADLHRPRQDAAVRRPHRRALPRAVTVGQIYILKLLHLVDDKIHARSTGPYSLITQQPLGGKAQFGGQRFGEMEVWALYAYGAAYVLQEILTVKSDDILGRVKAYEAIVKGENIPEPGIPESFKVLVKEMQSLCLDVEIMSEEGERDRASGRGRGHLQDRRGTRIGPGQRRGRGHRDRLGGRSRAAARSRRVGAGRRRPRRDRPTCGRGGVTRARC